MSTHSALEPPTTTRRGPLRQFGDVLARLGGGDPDILDKVRVARVHGRFVQMGLVLLSTAGLAVVSMSFALMDGLDVLPGVAIPAGFVWGFVILNLDRMLILNLLPGGGFRRTAAMVVPRLLIAALLGVVISTPLVLRVFQDEINTRIVQANVATGAQFATDVNATALAEELDRVRGEIARHEAALRGEVGSVVTPEIQARLDELAEAEQRLTTLRATSDDLFARLQCEREGAACAGSTDQRGNGPLARALQGQYDVAIGETNTAQQDVTNARAALELARENALVDSDVVLRQAQADANRDLPGLITRRDELQALQDTALDVGSTTFQDNNGILAQIVALHDIGEEDPEALVSHIALGLLFFMIELAPVLVKLMSSTGPPSLYDRMREIEDHDLIENAKVGSRMQVGSRDEDERREVAEAMKLRAIEDDMRHREQRLGFRANQHVENEMTNILDNALMQWSDTVRQTLNLPGGNQTAATQPLRRVAPAGPTVPGQGTPTAQGQATQESVRSKFGMPTGKNL